jgi:uncharacterized protein YndB with AHSA1/START domain
MTSATRTKSPMEGELTITRIIDAPRDLVYQAWTDPKHMVQWWGPKGFTNPVCEIDARVGGALHIVMRAPDGAEHPMGGIFQEVVKPERLVFTNIAVDAQGNALLEGLTTVTFEAEGARTRLTIHTRVEGKVPVAAQMLAGMEAGWTQSIDRLEALAVSQLRGKSSTV